MSSSAVPFAYDVVDYPSNALVQAHPGHLYAIARMFGVNAPPIETARILEVGCGDAIHSIACATMLPNATFVGVDLSHVAIERGNRIIAELKLTNVTLIQADLTQWQPPAELFDYIIAHGFYSWIPAFVRDALMDLMSRILSPSGIAYVSYNTLPGGHIRRMLWEMLKFHAEGANDPQTKINQAMSLANFLQNAVTGRDTSADVVLKKDLEDKLNRQSQSVLYHDDLAEVNDPIHVRDFLAHAGKYGLRFVGEADQFMMETGALPKETAEILNGLAVKDVVMKEQYLDFIYLRRFRQTLLTKLPGPIRSQADPQGLETLVISGEVKPEKSPVDLAPGVAVKFNGHRGAAVKIDLPVAKAALLAIGEAWPNGVTIAELAKLAARKLGKNDISAEERHKLMELLASIWMTDAIQLSGNRQVPLRTVSQKPKVSSLAHVQLRHGMVMTTGYFTPFLAEDEPAKRLIELCDGTRNHDQIAKEMLEVFPPGNRPTLEVIKANLHKNLDRLAQKGLLVG